MQYVNVSHALLQCTQDIYDKIINKFLGICRKTFV